MGNFTFFYKYILLIKYQFKWENKISAKFESFSQGQIRDHFTVDLRMRIWELVIPTPENKSTHDY